MTLSRRNAQLTEAICILNPVLSMGCFRGCGIHINVVEDDVGSVHHVDGPQLGLYHMEVADIDIANIPEHERHRSTRLGCAYGGTFGLVSLVVIPDLAIAIDTTRAMAVNTYVIASQNKSGSMVLELDVIVVVPPVFEVFRKLQVGQVSVVVFWNLELEPSLTNLPPTLLSNQCSHR